MVADSRFPPVGRRGFGSPFTQAAWGIKSAAEYLSVANEEVLVIVQIETKEAVENVEKIAAVDGIGELVDTDSTAAASINIKALYS